MPFSILDIGAMQPPEGVRPNFENPPNSNRQLIAVMTSVIAISTVFVIARTYTRLVLIKRWGWEDCEIPHSKS